MGTGCSPWAAGVYLLKSQKTLLLGLGVPGVSTARPCRPDFGVLPGGPAAASGRGTHHPEGEGRDHHGRLLPTGRLWDRALRGQAGGGGAGEAPPVGSRR